MTDNSHERGREVRARLWGDDTVALSEQFLGSFDAGFEQLVNEQLFGAVWNRPGLPIETRSMITIAALIALGKPKSSRSTFGAPATSASVMSRSRTSSCTSPTTPVCLPASRRSACSPKSSPRVSDIDRAAVGEL